MSKMVRKQIYIEPRQERLLKERARELETSEAALVRDGIDRVLLSGSALALPDEKAWREFWAVIRRRRRMEVPQTGRGWTREELYEDRLKRLSR
jgi:hypothetical protein